MSDKDNRADRRILDTIRQKPVDTNMQTHDLSQTMEIPLEALFDDLPKETTAHLLITYPDSTPWRVALTEEDVTIGRDESCDITLPLNNVSRNHASVVYSAQEYSVIDNRSTNGTLLNNTKISKCILRNNDVIRIGEARIRFVTETKG